MGKEFLLFMVIINPIMKMHKCTEGRRSMIVYDPLWQTMKKKGVSSYALRERYDVDSRTIRRLRANQNMTTDTLNKLCAILDCTLDEVARYIPDHPGR